MPKKHALLSASSSDRWIHCPPSARLSESYEDKGSDYAAEGTDAHALCEFKLKQALKFPHRVLRMRAVYSVHRVYLGYCRIVYAHTVKPVLHRAHLISSGAKAQRLSRIAGYCRIKRSVPDYFQIITVIICQYFIGSHALLSKPHRTPL